MIYHVLANLNHDNREYQRGDTIELSEGDSAARRLLELAVISTDPAPVVGAPATPEPEAPDRQPEVGGTRTETGEPSLDGQADQGSSSEAEDITPVVSEKMTRQELEDLAREKGIEEAEIEAAPNKGALVDLIITEKPAEEPAEPEADPSANL